MVKNNNPYSSTLFHFLKTLYYYLFLITRYNNVTITIQAIRQLMLLLYIIQTQTKSRTVCNNKAPGCFRIMAAKNGNYISVVTGVRKKEVTVTVFKNYKLEVKL